MDLSQKIKEISDILKKDEIDPTTAINILISTAQSSFDKPHFNDLDRALIAKALDCLEKKIKTGKNFQIKVK
jgi:hypothetical protein